MKMTIKKSQELVTAGYKDLGIYIQPSKELERLKENSQYGEILLKKLDNEGRIFSVFVK